MEYQAFFDEIDKIVLHDELEEFLGVNMVHTLFKNRDTVIEIVK
jgi:hypothetical protein